MSTPCPEICDEKPPLPNIRIPLRPTDADVVLQLQPLVDACYRDARCDRMNYQQPPVPPLSPADAAWAETLIRDCQSSHLR